MIFPAAAYHILYLHSAQHILAKLNVEKFQLVYLIVTSTACHFLCITASGRSGEAA
jgi:hypothetical protein